MSNSNFIPKVSRRITQSEDHHSAEWFITLLLLSHRTRIIDTLPTMHLPDGGFLGAVYDWHRAIAREANTSN